MGLLEELWKKFKGVEEVEDISSSTNGGTNSGTAEGTPKTNVTRTVVKVSTHFTIGRPKTDGVTSTTEKHLATPADFSLLVDVFRNALAGAKVDRPTRTALEGNLQTIGAEASKSTPNRSTIEDKLKDTESVIKRAGGDATLLELVSAMLQVAQYLYRS